MIPRAITIRSLKNRVNQSQRKIRFSIKLQTRKRKLLPVELCSQRQCSSGSILTSHEYAAPRDQHLRTSVLRKEGHLWVRGVIQFRNQAKGNKRKQVLQRIKLETGDQAKWISRIKTVEACWKEVTQLWQARKFWLQISYLNLDNRMMTNQTSDLILEGPTRNCINSKAQAWII